MTPRAAHAAARVRSAWLRAKSKAEGHSRHKEEQQTGAADDRDGLQVLNVGCRTSDARERPRQVGYHLSSPNNARLGP
jgi:hypothetical protein